MSQTIVAPTPSQHQLRAELETMVLGDLLGPAAGPDEEITERTVRDRYLVGVLAPSRSAGAATSPAVEEEEDEEIPLIPDELSEGGSDTADDGKTDADTPVTQAHLPSSFGMTFCVDGDAKSIQVNASWGQYKREKREGQTDYKGNMLRVWKRYARGGNFTVPLKNGALKAKAPDPQFPDIYVQGQIRKRSTHYVVTLFLVNAQEELRPKDESHIFQPKLVAGGVDGQAVFCKRTTLGTNNELEERLMAMMYRHHVEFAVGHPTAPMMRSKRSSRLVAISSSVAASVRHINSQLARGVAVPSRLQEASGRPALPPRFRSHADLLRRQVRPVPLQQTPGGGRGLAGRCG